MHVFEDSASRKWEIVINVNSLKRLKATLNVDLLSITDGELLERIASDPYLLADVIYVLIKPQADEKSITDEDFGEGLAGDAIDKATEALMEELVEFFPLSRRRILQKMIEKFRQVEEKALNLAEARVEAIKDDEILRDLIETDGS